MFVRLLVIVTIILAIVATVLLLPFEKKTVWDISGGLVGLLAGGYIHLYSEISSL